MWIGNWKVETENWKLEIGNWNVVTRDRKHRSCEKVIAWANAALPPRLAESLRLSGPRAKALFFWKLPRLTDGKAEPFRTSGGGAASRKPIHSHISSRSTICVVLGVFLLGLLAARASATTLVRMSLEQLSQAATDIVRGRVISQEMRWNETNTQIVTLTTIAVGQRIKSRAPATLVVEQPGGTVGNIRSRVAGTVPFQQSGEYVLFLEPSKAYPSRRLVVGMMQGAYRIYRDATTNEERVIQPFSKYAERDQADAAEPAQPGAVPTGAETIPLSQFNQQLSSAIAAPLVIPKGTFIPLVIETTEFEGVGRMHVVGRTTADLFPSPKTAIPAGSYIEGSAQKWQGVWKIYWTGMSVRGVSIPISASSEGFSESLRGQSMMVRVK